MNLSKWFAVRRELKARPRLVLALMSFLLPLLVWSMVSYVPFIWHPKIEITDPGGVSFFQQGMYVDPPLFQQQSAAMAKAGKPLPKGDPANPMYLPTPGAVAKAFYTAFTTPPQLAGEKWLHQSLWQSIQVIFWGFVISSILGVPLGILAGTYDFMSRLTEPFVEFFRYLPAPAFGALAVAILGINEAPKVAIIFIGTFFQQVLIVANTTRQVQVSLVEAAMTLGARGPQMLFRVVVPAILPNLYRDQRVLLGWAWTYLIVAELIGSSSGITWFITQQARYNHFANVYAAIMMIGILGLGTDIFLSRLARRLFPWERATVRN
jgi:NitT/TauT family transport system permease protein